jgi:hypothetical protein
MESSKKIEKTAVRDLTLDGRLSISDVSVLKKRGGGMHPLKLPSPTKLARLCHFPPASQVGHLAGPVFYVYVFSLGVYQELQCSSLLKSLWQMKLRGGVGGGGGVVGAV